MNIVAVSLDRARWIAGAKTGPAAVAQTILSALVIFGLNLLTSVYTARHLGPQGRGAQAAMSLWGPLIGYMLTLGVPTAVRYHARKHESQQESLFFAALALSGLLGVAAMIVGFLVIPISMTHYTIAEVHGAQVLMLFAPLGMIGTVLMAMLEVRFDFTVANFTKYSPPLATLIALVTLGFLHRLTPFTAALCYATPTALITIWIGIYLAGKIRLTPTDLARSTRRLVGYGIQVYGSDILTQLAMQVDQLLVIEFLNAADLGLYTVSLQAARVITAIPAALYIVLLPKVAGAPQHHIVATVSRAARLTTVITAPGGIALLVAMPFLLPGFYGHNFAPAIVVAQLLIGQTIIESEVGVLAQAFLACGKPFVVTIFQFLALSTAVPLMLALIPRFGIFGAALSLLAATLMRFAVTLFCYPAVLHVPVPNLLVTRDDFRYLLSAISARAATQEG